MPRGQLQETKLIARAWWRLAQPAAEGVRPPPEIASRIVAGGRIDAARI